MEKRRLGKNSSLYVTPIVFGAWGIGGPPFWEERDEKVSLQAIEKAVDCGINMIDTAPVYGFGHSEELIGKALEGKRDSVLIATKCGLRWKTENLATLYKDLSPPSIIKEVESSLRRLKTDRIDLYQIHWPDPDKRLEDTMAALVKLKEQGKIMEIGVSNFDTDLLEKALDLAPVVSVQPKYNLLEREIESSLLPFCVERGIGVIAYSPLASGLLTGKYDRNAKFTGWRGRGKLGIFREEELDPAMQKIENLKKTADELKVPLTDLAIKWVTKQKGVTAAIIGANKPEQVEYNVKAISTAISQNALDSLTDVV